ncbi:MAG: tail fiber domain-containing protein [Bacteroidetes bacterium]|nr:tail fiber domain-containing protein [Bacteroidota bacterium]
MTSATGENVGIGTSPDNNTRLRVVNDGGAYGIRGEAINDGKTRGVYGVAQGSIYAFGVHGTTLPSTGVRYAGYFSGDVHVTGTITSGSDALFKENVRPLDGEEDSQGRSVLERFELLQPVAYTFTRDAQYAHMNLPEGEQFGLISQDVETVFPELVSEEIHPAAEEEGEPITYKGLNYIHLAPILVHVVQKQQAEIDALRVLVEELMQGGN